jgi:16S rRNA (uracil1498-N3)-methyltransferase
METTDPIPRFRLFVEVPLNQGAEVVLSNGQAHYLLNVMRAKVGSFVSLFNGLDGEWTARVRDVAKKSAVLSVDRQARPQITEPDLWLLFAPVKRARIDLIAEKATELGVSILVPVHTRFTMATRVNTERLTAIAIEAAEQCGRLSAPEVRPATDLAAALGAWPAGRRLIVLDESGEGLPVEQALRTFPPGPAAILVGPEGGFDKSELDALRMLSFSTAVGLGPRILRADTAVVAALACFQAIRGDWRTSETKDPS